MLKVLPEGKEGSKQQVGNRRCKKERLEIQTNTNKEKQEQKTSTIDPIEPEQIVHHVECSVDYGGQNCMRREGIKPKQRKLLTLDKDEEREEEGTLPSFTSFVSIQTNNARCLLR